MGCEGVLVGELKSLVALFTGTHMINDGATTPRAALAWPVSAKTLKWFLLCSCCLKLDRVGLVTERLLTGSGAMIHG